MPEISTIVSSRLYYRKMGSGPALFLLHGFPESSPLWRNIWDELSSSFTLFLPDFPGSGESILERETTMSDMAACVKEIADHEKLDKVVVAGHSMGGYAALAFAAQYPEKVAGLSLVHSTTLPDDDERKKNRLKSIELIRKGARTTFVSQMVPNLFSEVFRNAHPAIVAEQIEQAMEIDDDGLVNFFKAMMDRPDQTKLLDTAVFPIQWIAGGQDNIISYKKILELCHRSTTNFVSYYEDCGHMSMFEAPTALAKDLHDFCTYCYKSA